MRLILEIYALVMSPFELSPVHDLSFIFDKNCAMGCIQLSESTFYCTYKFQGISSRTHDKQFAKKKKMGS